MADQINSQSTVDEAIRPSVSPTCNNKPTNQSINQSINQSFVLGSFGLSVRSLLVLLIPSFVPCFIQLGAKMSLFCRSSWIPPFSKVSTSLTKEGTSINQSFVLGSFGLSVSSLFVFLPSFLPSFIQLGAKMSLFCRSSWILPFSKGSTSLTKEGTSINKTINEWINQSIDKSKPKRVLPIIFRTAEECFFLKPFLRKRPSKRL